MIDETRGERPDSLPPHRVRVSGGGGQKAVSVIALPTRRGSQLLFRERPDRITEERANLDPAWPLPCLVTTTTGTPHPPLPTGQASHSTSATPPLHPGHTRAPPSASGTTLDPALLEEWSRLQSSLAEQVSCSDDGSGFVLDEGHESCSLRLVGGLDMSFWADEPKGSTEYSADGAAGDAGEGCSSSGSSSRALAGLVVLRYPGLREVVHEDYEEVDLAGVPYAPGFLGFRECPAYLRLLQRAAATSFNPQVLLVDGCGVLHPRGCGSASQLGVLSGYPTIGVAKNLLEVDGLTRSTAKLRRHTAVRHGMPWHSTGCPAVPHVLPCTDPDGGAAGAAAAALLAEVGGASPGRGSSPDAGSSTAEAAASARPAPVAALSSGGSEAPGSHPLASEAGGTEAVGAGAAGTDGGGIAAGGGMRGSDYQLLVGSSGRVLGAVLLAPTSRKPLYVSVGHRVSLSAAVQLVWRCCLHRIPEPIRQADLRTRAAIRAAQHKHK